MFSPIGAPKDTQDEIDWVDDLKFYIDNDTNLLSKTMFPAIRKHQKYKGHPKAFKLYMKPLKSCVESYCNKFQIDQPETKFPKDKLILLAKRIADEQSKFIERGDYEN